MDRYALARSRYGERNAPSTTGDPMNPAFPPPPTQAPPSTPTRQPQRAIPIGRAATGNVQPQPVGSAIGPGGTTTIPPTAAAMPWMDLAATHAPSSYNSPPPPAGAADLVAKWIHDNNLVADQANPQALHSITQQLHQHGYDAQVDYTDENGHTGGILINGHPYQLIDGSNHWTPLQAWEESGGDGGANVANPAGVGWTAGTGTGGMGGSLDSVFEKALADMAAQGLTPMGQDVGTTLMDIIRKGHAPDLSNQLVAAREAEGNAFTGQIADARGALADRGLVSEPGVGQGAETTAVGRISENLAGPYSQAVADIEGHGMDLAHEDVTNALQLATGMSTDQARTILGAVGTGSQREVALAGIALQALAGDRDWSKFLATFGLTHTLVLEQLRQGRVSLAIQLANSYNDWLAINNLGFHGPN